MGTPGRQAGQTYLFGYLTESIEQRERVVVQIAFPLFQHIQQPNYLGCYLGLNLPGNG